MMHGMCLKFNLRLLQFLIFLLFSTILSNYWTLSNNERGRLLKIKTPYGRLATIPGAGTRRKMMYFIYRQGTGNVYVTIYICIYIYRERESCASTSSANNLFCTEDRQTPHSK